MLVNTYMFVQNKFLEVEQLGLMFFFVLITLTKILHLIIVFLMLDIITLFSIRYLSYFLIFSTLVIERIGHLYFFFHGLFTYSCFLPVLKFLISNYSYQLSVAYLKRSWLLFVFQLC